MQFIDLHAQYRQIQNAVQEQIAKVLEHGHYIMGPEVHELETELAKITGTRHCITCSSGTDALLMTLMAWNIREGDAVFVPDFTFFATAEVVALLGATPVFVDVDPRTFNMQPAALRKAIQAVQEQNSTHYPLPALAKTRLLTPRAVIPVDLFGISADYPAILPIAQEFGLLVLEDAAQAFGARHGNKKACNMGCQAAATSFFPAKPLGCYGDGGAIFTNDSTLAQNLISLRTHGKGEDKYENIRVGLNGRMDTLQAAILLAKLTVFPEECTARQKVAAQYTQFLAALPDIKCPFIPHDCHSVYAQYSVLVPPQKRNAICNILKQRGIPTNIYYPHPLHMQRAFANLLYQWEDMPVSSALSRSILSLPFHPYMQEADIAAVCTDLQAALQ